MGKTRLVVWWFDVTNKIKNEQIDDIQLSHFDLNEEIVL